MYSNIILTAFGGVISMHISLTTWKVIVVVMLKNNDACMMIVTELTYFIQELVQSTKVSPSEDTIPRTSESLKLIKQTVQ